MNKNILIAIAAIVLAAGGIYYYKQSYSLAPATNTPSATNDSVFVGEQAAPEDNTVTTTTTTTSVTTTAKVVPISVSIQNFSFTPGPITIKKGTTVTWTNKDVVSHTVTSSDTNGPLNSALIAQNGTYSFIFNTIGTFSYHCKPHPNMIGTVVVTE